jgi:hypothetical protein
MVAAGVVQQRVEVAGVVVGGAVAGVHHRVSKVATKPRGQMVEVDGVMVKVEGAGGEGLRLPG